MLSPVLAYTQNRKCCLLECLACLSGDSGPAILEHSQVQPVSEATRQRAVALPARIERVRDGFMTFSHLWTRPPAEALQVILN